MLKAINHKDFDKDYARLRPATQKRFEEKYEILMKGLWSLSIEGDIRVIYQYVAKDIVLFLRIGSHNQVYQ